MRILMLAQGLPFPVYGDGLTVRVYHLLRELSRSDTCHLVSIASRKLSSSEEEELRRMASSRILPTPSHSGWTTTARKVFSAKRFHSKFLEESVREEVKSFRPDVVIAEQTFMATYESAFRDIPSVMSAVDAIALAARKQAALAPTMLGRAAWRYVAAQRLRVERRYFHRFDRVTVVAEEDARFLRAELGLAVAVIPNGVDIDFFQPARQVDVGDAIVFTGNLSAPMNGEAAEHIARCIVPALRGAGVTLPVVVAGRGPSPQLREACRGVCELLSDVGDIRDVLRRAKVVVSPIEYGTGIKNNVLQAMAMGLPCVVTPLIGVPVGMKDDETGVIAERGESFVRAIVGLVRDSERRQRLGQAARALIEARFSWASVAGRYRELCLSALNLSAEARREEC